METFVLNAIFVISFVLYIYGFCILLGFCKYSKVYSFCSWYYLVCSIGVSTFLFLGILGFYLIDITLVFTVLCVNILFLSVDCPEEPQIFVDPAINAVNSADIASVVWLDNIDNAF